MPLHQRLKGSQVAPFNGVEQVAVVGDHLVQSAGGHGVQHPEAAVVRVGVLQRAPQIHLIHSRKPGLVQQAVGLVQLVVVRGLGPCKGFVGIHPHPDQRPLLRGAFGGEVPQDLCLHRRALVDQFIHDAAVQAGDGGALVGHDAHQTAFFQALQHHPDQGARCAEAGTQRVFTQGGAGTDGQVDDLPLQHRIDLSISFVLFHRFHQGAASFREQIPGGSVRQRQREVHDPAGVWVYELQTAALQGNGTLHTAAVFAVAP